MTTQKKHVTWDYVEIYVPLVRALGRTSAAASEGFVLLLSDGAGSYQYTDQKPELDETVAGYLVQKCIIESFVDEDGEVVTERMLDADPLSDCETVAAVIAKDVVRDFIGLQDLFGTGVMELIAQMKQAGLSQAVILLVPQHQTEDGKVNMGLNPIALPVETTVESTPQAVQDAIDAETAKKAEEPDNVNNLLDNDEDDDEGDDE